MLHYENSASFKAAVKNKNGILLGIDYGLKRTGIASTDTDCLMAFADETIPTLDLQAYIEDITHTRQIKGIVIGWPRKGNQVHPIAKNILEYANKIAASFEILLWDERMSTIGTVKSINHYHGFMNKNNSRQIKMKNDDHHAAQYILEQVVELINTI